MQGKAYRRGHEWENLNKRKNVEEVAEEESSKKSIKKKKKKKDEKKEEEDIKHLT